MAAALQRAMAGPHQSTALVFSVRSFLRFLCILWVLHSRGPSFAFAVGAFLDLHARPETLATTTLVFRREGLTFSPRT